MCFCLGIIMAPSSPDIIQTIVYHTRQRQFLYFQSYPCFLRQKERLLSSPLAVPIIGNDLKCCPGCHTLYRNSTRHLLKIPLISEKERLALVTAENEKIQQQLLEANRELRNRRQNDIKRAQTSLSAFGQSEKDQGRICCFGNLKSAKNRKEMDTAFKCIERILTVKNKSRLDDPVVTQALESVRNMIASVGWTNKSNNRRGKNVYTNRVILIPTTQ